MKIRAIYTFTLTLLTLCLALSLIPPFTTRLGAPYENLTGELQLSAGSGLRVAIVKPVFTATAYSGRFGGSSSFYEFYDKHADDPHTQNITTDLNLLNVSVVDGWGWSDGLGRYITSVVGDYGLGTIGGARSFTILSDINVTEGALFNQDGSSRYDVVVLGFTEYVTFQEYSGYQRFVASGGRLVVMDASSFVAEVKYYPQTNHLALVSGHGWGFDGLKVWRNDDHFIRWKDENVNWVGSNECFFHNTYAGATVIGDYPISVALKQRFGPVVFLSYSKETSVHEENSVTNMTDTTILARWIGSSLDSENNIAAYLHRYINGTVLDIGVMSSQVVDQDMSVQFFMLSSIEDSTTH